MDNEKIWNLIAKKLAGEASPEELLELEKILRTDPDLHYSLQVFYDLWVSRQAPEKGQAGKAFDRHLERMQAAGSDYFREEPVSFPEIPAGKNYRKAFWTASFFAGFFLLLTGIYWMSRPHHPLANTASTQVKKPGEVVTQNGTRTKLLLPDGTSVWLNAGSRLVYDSTFDHSRREVSLTGEGYFDVVKNPARPFIIHTGKIDIRVLGTVFNVKSYPDEPTIETSLIQGSIEVSFRDNPASGRIVLKPHEKLVVSTAATPQARPGKILAPVADRGFRVSRLTYAKADSLLIETAWTRNKLVFEDESFKDLAAEMERWYGVHIRFDSSKRDTLHFTGSFENETIQQALDALKLTAGKAVPGFNYTIHGEDINIMK